MFCLLKFYYCRISVVLDTITFSHLEKWAFWMPVPESHQWPLQGINSLYPNSGKKQQPNCNTLNVGVFLKFRWNSRFLCGCIPSAALLLLCRGIIVLQVIPRYRFAENSRFNWYITELPWNFWSPNDSLMHIFNDLHWNTIATKYCADSPLS